MGKVPRVLKRACRIFLVFPLLGLPHKPITKTMKFPFFGGNKWSPKKTPLRKSQSLNNLVNLDANQRQREFGIDTIDGPTSLRLTGGPEIKFSDGKWTLANDNENQTIADSVISTAAQKELATLKGDQLRLSEENNMYKLKIEILLDMLTELTELKNPEVANQMLQQMIQSR